MTIDQVFHARAVFHHRAEEMRRYLDDPRTEVSADSRAHMETTVSEYRALVARFTKADLRSPAEKRLDAFARRVAEGKPLFPKRRRRRRHARTRTVTYGL